MLDQGNLVELRREAFTMALYVSICLLAALTAVSDEHADQADTFRIVWGTTVGLAIAHWFAFRMSARLVASGATTHHDAESAIAQIGGAAAVAILATIPVLVFPDSAELDVARLALAGFITLVGYAVARGGGASRTRSLIYATAVLIVAAGVAVIKNYLAGH